MSGKKKTSKKPKLKKFLVSVETTDYHEEEILARSKKEALIKFYEEGDGQFLDGSVAHESVEKVEEEI